MFVCLFLAGLGLCCFEGFSLVPASRGHSLVVVHGLLIEVASLVAEDGLQDTWASVVVACGLSSCHSWLVAALDYKVNSCCAQA